MTFEVTAAQLARAHWFSVDDLLKDSTFELQYHLGTVWLINHRDGYTWRILADGSAAKYSVGLDAMFLGDRQPALVFPKSEAIAKSLKQDPPLHDWRS